MSGGLFTPTVVYDCSTLAYLPRVHIVRYRAAQLLYESGLRLYPPFTVKQTCNLHSSDMPYLYHSNIPFKPMSRRRREKTQCSPASSPTLTPCQQACGGLPSVAPPTSCVSSPFTSHVRAHVAPPVLRWNVTSASPSEAGDSIRYCDIAVVVREFLYSVLAAF